MNILLSLLGWLAWTVGLLSYEKDKADDLGQTFSLKNYALKYWDNWLLSATCVPILIIIGAKKLGLDPIGVLDVKHLHWHDLYYLAAGPAAEMVKVLIKRVSKWRVKKENE
jgi:hypothetical protein